MSEIIESTSVNGSDANAGGIIKDAIPSEYPHPSRKVSVFPKGTKKDLRLPLHVDIATEGKQIAEVRGMSRVLLFTEYIERGLAEDKVKYQMEIEELETKSNSSAISECPNEKEN